jgi:hypothetical protein
MKTLCEEQTNFKLSALLEQIINGRVERFDGLVAFLSSA